MVSCSVFSCRNNNKTLKAGSKPHKLFRIPSEKDCKKRIDPLKVERRKKWLIALNLVDATEQKLINARVCGRHFIKGQPAEESDVDNPDWVPNLFLDFNYQYKTTHKISRKMSKRLLKNLDITMVVTPMLNKDERRARAKKKLGSDFVCPLKIKDKPTTKNKEEKCNPNLDSQDNSQNSDFSNADSDDDYCKKSNKIAKIDNGDENLISKKFNSDCIVCKNDLRLFETKGFIYVCTKCRKSYHARCHIPIVTSHIKRKGWMCIDCCERNNFNEKYVVDFIKSISPSTNFVRDLDEKFAVKNTTCNKNDAEPCLNFENQIDVPDVSNWTVDDVHEYFTKKVSKKVGNIFLEHRIDGEVIKLLNRDTVLNNLGIEVLGDALNTYFHVLILTQKTTNIPKLLELSGALNC